MTRKKAKEILELLDSGGKVDKEGYITGCCIWTSTIDKIRKLGVLIYFNDDKELMQISDWPAYMDRREDRIVKFVGFNRENMELRVVDDGAGHDHLEIWKDHERLGYAHISENVMTMFSDKEGSSADIYFKR